MRCGVLNAAAMQLQSGAAPAGLRFYDAELLALLFHELCAQDV